jgi:hypothetical protein
MNEVIKYNNDDIRKATVKVVKLIQKTIRNKRRPADGHRIKKRTGDLLRNIKPVFIIDGNDLYIDIQAMHYYTYISEGTKNIKPWEITKSVFQSKEMNDILVELVGNAAANTLVDITSKIK